MMAINRSSATAIAPGKAILFGEHAINCGQPALSVSVGLYARCTVTLSDEDTYLFCSGDKRFSVDRSEILLLAESVDAALAAQDYNQVRAVAAANYFAPSMYVLAKSFGSKLPKDLHVRWQSELPPFAGLGSGGAAFTTLAAAAGALIAPGTPLAERTRWGHRGDIVAHGGVASALDSQTSLLGGVVRFAGTGLADQVPVAPGMRLVIADCGVKAATSEVNGRVRQWRDAFPAASDRYFRSIGVLSRAALQPLAEGNWDELGCLMLLNQAVLEKVGVSCREIDFLVEAATGAGAYGAKLSGSGGGGIVIALVNSETKAAVAAAMTACGGTVYTPKIAVPGMQILQNYTHQ